MTQHPLATDDHGVGDVSLSLKQLKKMHQSAALAKQSRAEFSEGAVFKLMGRLQKAVKADDFDTGQKLASELAEWLEYCDKHSD